MGVDVLAGDYAQRTIGAMNFTHSYFLLLRVKDWVFILGYFQIWNLESLVIVIYARTTYR